VLHEIARRTTGAHAAVLPTLIEDTLAGAGLRIADVDAVAVSIGPGSFTGLRLALGLAKGLVYARGLVLIGVSTLEALAHVAEVPAGALVCAALDARKREVYAACFRATAGGGRERLGPDEALAPAVLAARLPSGVVLVGDAAEAYPEAFAPFAARLPFDRVHPQGGVVAALGARALAAGESSPPGDLEPHYVRPPDAMPPAGPAPRPVPR
jgi:tRNA threonylcarbamoyladenosine biosynthesis protein TsaB